MLHPVAFVCIAFLVLVLICLLEEVLTRDNVKVFVTLVSLLIMCAIKMLASQYTTNLMLFYFGGFVMNAFLYAMICFSALGVSLLRVYEERLSTAHANFTMLRNAGAAAA